jgi:hypothetical protein
MTEQATVTPMGEPFPPVVSYPAGVANVVPTYRRTAPPLPYPGTPASPPQVASVLQPAVASLVPASAKLGDPNFTLRVLGTKFSAQSVILWNGSPEPTTFVSATEVTTAVNMATAQVAMPIPVKVRTFTLESNAVSFDLQAAADVEAAE